MEEGNKRRIRDGIIVMLLFMWAMCVIATCVFLWNETRDAQCIAASVIALIGMVVSSVVVGQKTKLP